MTTSKRVGSTCAVRLWLKPRRDNQNSVTLAAANRRAAEKCPPTPPNPKGVREKEAGWHEDISTGVAYVGL